MKRILLGLVICGIAGALAGCIPPSSILKTGDVLAPGAAPRYGPVVADIEDMIRQTMSRSRIPGLSVVICDSQGPIWEAGFGYGDDGRTVTVDGNTLFSIQSMSKTFTAVGVLTAVRDGLVDLDVPISRSLPDFRIQSIFEDRPQDRITLRHLLMHTAGFTHEAPGGGNNDGTEIAFDRHVANIQDTWLMCRVGERYQYSNLGIDLAGYIVERVSGTPFIDYMGRERLRRAGPRAHDDGSIAHRGGDEPGHGSPARFRPSSGHRAHDRGRRRVCLGARPGDVPHVHAEGGPDRGAARGRGPDARALP